MAYPVTALGPGRRLALWLAGCTIRCPGCVTPQLWNQDAGTELTGKRLWERIRRIDCALDGITITGGEPFEQADGLAQFLGNLREQRPEWNILVYSGYNFTTLRRRHDAKRLMAVVDVLISGPYRRKLKSRRPLMGSSNQRVYSLSIRGREMVVALDGMPAEHANLAVGAHGRNWLVGVLSDDGRARVHGLLGIDKE